MTKLKNIIIPEIGYNHLGSLYNLRHAMITIAKEFGQFTIQYRENLNKSDLLFQIDIKIILNEIKSLRLICDDVSIGLATESLEVIMDYGKYFDFFKILSIGINNKNLINYLSKQDKLHIYSVGNTPISELNSRIGKFYYPNKIPYLNFTSFDISGIDISTSEIKELSSKCEGLCYGLHQKDDILLYSAFSIFTISFLFVYVSLSLDPIIKPDHIHSRSINELKNMTQNLSAILDFKSRSQRTNLKDFKNET